MINNRKCKIFKSKTSAYKIYKTHNVDSRDYWLFVKHLCEESRVTAILNFSPLQNFFVKGHVFHNVKIM